MVYSGVYVFYLYIYLVVIFGVVVCFVVYVVCNIL